MRLQVREEIVAGEQRGARILERVRARGARAAIEERELAEELAGPHDRDERLLTELARQRDLHRALEDEVEVRARIILPEDRLAPAEALRAYALSELGHLALGKPREQRQATEMLGDALLLGHGRDYGSKLDGPSIMSGPWTRRRPPRMPRARRTSRA